MIEKTYKQYLAWGDKYDLILYKLKDSRNTYQVIEVPRENKHQEGKDLSKVVWEMTAPYHMVLYHIISQLYTWIRTCGDNYAVALSKIHKVNHPEFVWKE
tara:strand:- start:1284 stop:1583 length:300 start_codon:yes stop_codon:yes gene_type:complete